MGSSPTTSPPPPPSAQGTSLVDRVNLAIHFRRYLKLIGRRWLILLVCSAVAAGYSAYRAYTTPNMYRAWSVIMLALKVQTSSTANKVQVLEEMQNYYSRHVGYMTSDEVLKKVEARMNGTNSALVKQPWHHPSAVVDGSSFIMNVDSTDFEYARRYAIFWAHEFLDYKKRLIDVSLGKSQIEVEQQIVNDEDKLAAARDDLEKFRKEKRIGSASDMLSGAQRQLEQQEADYNATVIQRQRLQKNSAEDIANGALGGGTKGAGEKSTDPKQKDLITDTADPLAKFATQSNYRELKLDLLGKEDEYKAKSEDLTPEHPLMARLANEIEKLKLSIKHQLEMIDAEQQARIKSLVQAEAIMKPKLDELREHVLDLATTQHELDRLVEKESNIKKELDDLRRVMQAFGLSSKEEGQFTIQTEGGGSSTRISPRRSRMILNGLLVGLSVGLAIVYFLHRMDDRLDLAEDIERSLGEPVLGQIPQVDMKQMTEGRLLITRLQQHDMFAESIRGVRSAVLLSKEGGANKVLLISSAVPGDGKTTFTVNFAATLAIGGHRVLLVDADLRRGNIHSYFNLPREQGLADVLNGLHWSDVLKETEVKTLHIISSGGYPPNPGELLGSPIMAEFISEAKADFDHIIIDCPPLTAIDDTFALVNMADGLLFVVRAGQTSMRFAKSALEAVSRRGARILGIVLNGITADNPYYYYNYYYHAYYNKGQAQGQAGESASAPLPAQKMAASKSRRSKLTSIQAQAATLAGQRPSPRILAAEERAKAEEFKAKRVVGKGPEIPSPDTAFIKKEISAAKEARAQDPKNT